jgi:hypothetical protein
MPGDEARDKIIDERFATYRQRLGANDATPMVLLGIRHDSRSREITVCITEDCQLSELRRMLMIALQSIDQLIEQKGVMQ